MQARGLKLDPRLADDRNVRSRLMQARGLKLHVTEPAGVVGHVAPHAGAWIETT